MPKNIIADGIAGILGIPGKILETTGLDSAAEVAVDSLNADGQLSVSHLLDLGGVRTRKKQIRENAMKLQELQLQQAEANLKNAVLTGDTRELGLKQAQRAEAISQQDLSVQQVQSLGNVAEQQGIAAGQAAADTTLGPGTTNSTLRVGQRVGLAAQQGIAEERQFLRDTLGTTEVEDTIAARRERATLVNSQLVNDVGMSEEEAVAFTDTLTGSDLSKLQGQLASGKFQLKRSKELAKARDASSARRRAASDLTKDATDFQKTKFETGVADQIGRSIGAVIENEETGDLDKQKRPTGSKGFTRSELAILPKSKAFGSQFLSATRNSTAAGYAAEDNFLLNHPTRKRFDILGSLGGGEEEFVTKDRFFPLPNEQFGGTGVGPVDDEAADALMLNMAKRVNKTRVIWDAGGKLVDGRQDPADVNAPLIKPYSPAYWLNWADAINEVPGWSMEITKEGKVILETGNDELNAEIRKLLQGS